MYFSDLHQQVREMTHGFATDVIRPLAEELDREERFPAEIYEQMAELGLFGICVPKDMGGPGFDTVAYAVVMEELSRGYASVADQCGLVELITSLLVAHGTAEQRAHWLPNILTMRTKVAYCITEPEAGTDVSGIRTTAVRDGDGWVLSGSKIWIHNAPVADVGLVLPGLILTQGTAACRSLSSTFTRLGSHVDPKSIKWVSAHLRSGV